MKKYSRDDPSYNPRPKICEWLARGFEHVQSAPYKVSARWVFYRLLEDGFFDNKDDYTNKFEKPFSKARHAISSNCQAVLDWKPDTVIDETIMTINRTGYYETAEKWRENLRCYLDHNYTQPVYLEIWFEARAMIGQFQHYTERILLRPFGGYSGIFECWNIAKELERAADSYQKPMQIIYFGDLDQYGEDIGGVSLRYVRKWCEVEFDFVKGTTDDQIKDLRVKQWEAISDQQAGEIIQKAIAPFFDQSALDLLRDKERKAVERLA